MSDATSPESRAMAAWLAANALIGDSGGEPVGYFPPHRAFVNPGGEVEPWCAKDGQLWPCESASSAIAERESDAVTDGTPGQTPAEETWVPADGSAGVAHLEFDEHGIAQVTRECMTMLLARAGFIRAEATS